MAVNRASGAVTRLYVSKDVTHIRLQIPEAEQPQDNYFHLLQSHSNYNALYSLALSAAINGYTLSIRTVGDISPTEHANVLYMYVDW